MRKLPQHISNEELLASLESADDTESIEWSNDVPQFLAKFKIDQGKYKVRKSLLYKLYRIYSNQPIPSREFSISAADFLPLASDPYFTINIPAIKIAKIVHVNNRETKINFNASLNIKKHYEKFLLDVSIKKGTNWVQADILHEIYRFYCIDKGKQLRINPINFVTVSKLYFTSKRIGSSRAMWFQIDNEVIQRTLSPEDIDRVINRRHKNKKEN